MHAVWLAAKGHLTLYGMSRSSKVVLLGVQDRYSHFVQLHALCDLWCPPMLDIDVVYNLEAARIIINARGYMKSDFQLCGMLSVEAKAKHQMISPAVLESFLMDEIAHLAQTPQIVKDYIAAYTRFHNSVE